MSKLYRAYCRSVTRAQCSPVAILGVLVVIAVIAFAARYQREIIEALRIAAACLLCAVGLALLGWVTWAISSANHGRAAPEPKARPAAPKTRPAAPKTRPAAPAAAVAAIAETPASEAEEMAAVADRLADDRTMIRLTPDGAALELTREGA
jgi:hypothetical protein